MVFPCVLFGFSLTKAFKIFTDKVDLKKQFCKNGGDGVLLQTLIMQRRTRFNTILKLRYTQHFLFVKDVLDLWYSGFFVFVYIYKKILKTLRKQDDLAKKKSKKQLIDSIANNDIIKTKELNKKADKVEKPEDAAAVIK